MKMQRWKRVTARCLLLLCAAAIALPAQAAHADEVNLALKKSVEVTREHEGSAKRLVDGDKTKAGRWMTEAPAAEAHSAIVDLQKVEKVNFSRSLGKMRPTAAPISSCMRARTR